MTGFKNVGMLIMSRDNGTPIGGKAMTSSSQTFDNFRPDIVRTHTHMSGPRKAVLRCAENAQIT